MKLLLVRHGETDWNLQGRSQGHTDIPLNDNGIRQAKCLAERLRGIEITGAYCSDLVRARVTAETVLAGRDGMTAIVDPRLRELGLGVWEGLHATEIASRYQREREEWVSSPSSFRISGGETLVEVQARMDSAFDAILSSHDEGTVLVVSHGYALITWICGVLGLHLDRFRHIWLDPTGVSEVIRMGERWILRGLNDRSHLS